MKTAKVKEISNWMMIIGGGIFTCGFGAKSIATRIERKEYREQALREKSRLNMEAIKASTKKNEVYASKLEQMDQSEFARIHAEKVAQANADVLAQAEQIKLDAERKIAEARKERDIAVTKYKEIDNLFTNKDKIMDAKDALDAAYREDERSKKRKEELMNTLGDLL